MSVEFYRGSPGQLDSRTLNRKTLSRWTGRSSNNNTTNNMMSSTNNNTTNNDTTNNGVHSAAHTSTYRERVEVRRSTRVVLGDIQNKRVVRCSLDSCRLNPGNLPRKLPSLNTGLY